MDQTTVVCVISGDRQAGAKVDNKGARLRTGALVSLLPLAFTHNDATINLLTGGKQSRREFPSA